MEKQEAASSIVKDLEAALEKAKAGQVHGLVMILELEAGVDVSFGYTQDGRGALHLIGCMRELEYSVFSSRTGMTVVDERDTKHCQP